MQKFAKNCDFGHFNIKFIIKVKIIEVQKNDGLKNAKLEAEDAKSQRGKVSQKKI